MKAVILAAGMSKRLGFSMPKSLLRIGTESIIDRLINQLLTNNISDIVIVVGWKSENLIQEINCHFPNNEFKYVFNHQFYNTNTAYSLWLARKFLTTPFLCIHADMVCDTEIISHIVSNPKQNCCSVDHIIRVDEDAMKIRISNDKIFEFSKELPLHKNHGTAIGIYKFNMMLFSLYVAQLDNTGEFFMNKYVADVLSSLSSQSTMYVDDISYYRYIDVDNLSDYHKAVNLFDRRN